MNGGAVMAGRTPGTDAGAAAKTQGTEHLKRKDFARGLPPGVQNVLSENRGEPLESAARSFMESRFNTHFGDVRVHHDLTARQSAQTIGARAYTVGHDIVFSDTPSARETSGRRLLAHELAHVIQQRRGGVEPALSSSAAHEVGARRAASDAVSTVQKPVAVQGATAVGLARAGDDDLRAMAAEDAEFGDLGGNHAERSRDKQRDADRRKDRQKRGDQRRTSAEQAHSRANKTLGKLEQDAAAPGASSRSPKRKEKQMQRYEEAVKGLDEKPVVRNQRKGAFFEGLHTPNDAVAQPKFVAGSPELPGMDLRHPKRKADGKKREQGEDRPSYTQPDYTRSKGGKRKVNELKSHDLRYRTPSDLRKIANSHISQAKKRDLHLPLRPGAVPGGVQGDDQVIRLRPLQDAESRNVMLRRYFGKGSPVQEVHFGSTAVRRSEWKDDPPSVKPKKKGKSAPRKKAAAGKKATPASPSKAPQKKGPASPKKPSTKKGGAASKQAAGTKSAGAPTGASVDKGATPSKKAPRPKTAGKTKSPPGVGTHSAESSDDFTTPKAAPRRKSPGAKGTTTNLKSNVQPGGAGTHADAETNVSTKSAPAKKTVGKTKAVIPASKAATHSAGSDQGSDSPASPTHKVAKSPRPSSSASTKSASQPKPKIDPTSPPKTPAQSKPADAVAKTKKPSAPAAKATPLAKKTAAPPAPAKKIAAPASPVRAQPAASVVPPARAAKPSGPPPKPRHAPTDAPSTEGPPKEGAPKEDAKAPASPATGSPALKPRRGPTVQVAARPDGSITAEVSEVPGYSPKKYAVTVQVMLGGSVSAAAEQAGKRGSATAHGSLSGAVRWSHTYQFSEEQKNAYLSAINNNTSSPYQEIAAANLWAQGNSEQAKALISRLGAGAPDVDSILAHGEGSSSQFSADLTAQAGGSVSAKGFGVEGSASISIQNGWTVAHQQGRYLVGRSFTKEKNQVLGGSVSYGLMSMGYTGDSGTTESIAVNFVVQDSDNEIREKLGTITAVKNIEELGTLALNRKDLGGSVTVSRGSSSGGTVKVAIAGGALGAEGGQQGFKNDSETRDAEGNVSHTYLGGSNTRVALTIKGHDVVKLNDESAIATTVHADNTADGQSYLNRSESDLTGSIGNALSHPIAAAQAVRRGDTDALLKSKTDKFGANLVDDHYGALIQAAKNPQSWENAWRGELIDDLIAWRAILPAVQRAGNDRTAVAKLVQDFKSGGDDRRRAIVERAMGVTADDRFEFPDSIKNQEDVFNSLVISNPTAYAMELAQAGKTDEAMAELKSVTARLDALSAAIAGAAQRNEFKSPAVYITMRQRIDARRPAVRAAMKSVSAPAVTNEEIVMAKPRGGKTAPTPTPIPAPVDAQPVPPEPAKAEPAPDPAADLEELQRTTARLLEYRTLENSVFAKMEAEFKGSTVFGYELPKLSMPDVETLGAQERLLKEAYPKWDKDIAAFIKLTGDPTAAIPFKPNKARYLQLDKQVPYHGYGGGLSGFEEI